MPEVRSDILRIFCICGQKMKVSEKMYGLPGKCVACRQKIRIPRKDEVPEGVTEIHLREHPELLRGTRKPPVASEEEREANRALALARASRRESTEESTPNTEIDLLDSPPVADSTRVPPSDPKKRTIASVPLDVLPQLQVLCSLNFKLSRQLDTLQLNSHDDEVRLAELEGHISRVRKLRNRLDDHLHQVLMETAIELANTQEKLAQLKLSARVGETPWVEFRDGAHRLRARRDKLERRQQNLRGWLAVKDPYLAGGLLDLSVDSMPTESSAASLPAEPEDDSSPLTALTTGLREALDERARVRQRLSEVQRMGEGGGREIEELRREVGQERLLARARVAYYQDRLQQLKKDYSSDVETANAALSIARDKLRMDRMARDQYDLLEREVLRSKRDIARAQSVIARSLGANSGSEVPSPRGTFLERLGISTGGRIGADSIAGYVAVALFAASIITPAIGTKSLLSTAVDHGAAEGPPAFLFLIPLSLGALVAFADLVPASSVRGWIRLAGGVIGVLAGAYLVNEGGYGLGSIASRFRTVSPWYLQPGIVLYFLGCVAMWCAGALTLWHPRQLRVWPPLTAVAAALAVFAIFTDAFGAFRPEPTVVVATSGASDGTGVIRVTNSGGRAAHLLSRPADSRDGFRFLVERRMGTTSYAPATGEGPLFESRQTDGTGALFTVEAGGVQEIPFALESGEYRVTLEPRAPAPPIETTFAVEGPAPEPQPAAPPLASAAGNVPVDAVPPAAGSTTEPALQVPDAIPGSSLPVDSTRDVAPAAPAQGPEVELSGIIATNGDTPRFTLDLYFPDGTSERLSLALGETVWGDWVIEEYNPDELTVTLIGDGQLLILRRGAPIELTR